MREWSPERWLIPRPPEYKTGATTLCYPGLKWSRWPESDRRSPSYEDGAIPLCYTGSLFFHRPPIAWRPIHLTNDFKQLDDALPNVHGLVIGRSREDVNGFRQFILHPFFHAASLHFRHAAIYPIFCIWIDNRILVAIAPPVLFQPITQFLGGPIGYG